MFAAAVLVARWVWDAIMVAAKFVAGKALILAVMLYVLPFVMRRIIIWMFQFISENGREMFVYANEMFTSMITSSGLAQEVNFELTGIGGYFAIQTGLVESLSIISSGWALYWMIIMYRRAASALPFVRI